SVNATLEAEVLTRSSHSSVLRNSSVQYPLTKISSADISEMKLKKILIEKMEGNKHQLALPLKRQPRVQAKLPKGLNLDNSLPNTALPAAQGDAQSWISDLAKQADARSSFNELLDTPIDFSNFIMHRLNVDTLTPDLLAGPTYELMTPDLLVPRLVL
nr:hypothetical protein [Tanacetum cinerariifolium]